MVLPSDDGGVEVADVIPGSPADNTGLKSGDLIITLNDNGVSGAESFISCIEDMGADSNVTLKIRRDGDEKTLHGTLGCIQDAPMAFVMAAMANLYDLQPQGDSERTGANVDPTIEQTLDELWQRVRELEKEMDQFKDGDADEANSSDDDLTDIRSAEGDYTLVVQRGGNKWNTYRRGYHRGISWNTYRYGNRGGYTSPFNRYPGYGNSYYQYQGRPYYYGGRNPYRYGTGYRGGGLQLGPNLRIFW